MSEPNEDREPGLYITVRLDSVGERYNNQRMRTEKAVETLVDATNQRFSPAVMASMLHALADEVHDNRPSSLPF